MVIPCDFTQICRLCLVKDKVNVFLFDNNDTTKSILEKINSCLPVTVSENDNLPKKICDICLEKLNATYAFQNTTLNSEKQLLTWLAESSSKSASSINDVAIEVLPDTSIVKEEAPDPDIVNELNEELHSQIEETEEPVPKRPRRSTALNRPVIEPDTEEDEDVDDVEPISKFESEDEDLEKLDIPSYLDPTTLADQPGPSGVGKESGEPTCLTDFLTPIVTIDEGDAKVRRDAKMETVTTNAKKTKGRPRKNATGKAATSGKIRVKSEFALQNDSVLYQCPICKGEEKRTLPDLRQHYKSEHIGKRLRTSILFSENHPCDVCGKELRHKVALREHMETHNNSYNCEECGLNHKKPLDHVIHMRSHSAEGVFKCIFCEFTTEELVEITKHLTGEHETIMKYRCNICNKGFQIFTWFIEHDNFHTGLKPFECQFCGKTFLYSRYLSAHKNSMHKEEITGVPNIHECVICKKQYQHKNSLNLHMNSHTGNFAICDVCGKILSSKEKLKFHLRTHTGYKPFSCNYCGKSFTKKPILVEHVRIHTGERPYVCEYCTKCFSQRSSLVIHIRSHTGERPYVCHLCDKGFVAKAMLNIHLKCCKGAPITLH